MATTSPGITADQQESVRKLFGSTMEILRRVRIESRSGRTEEKLLVLTSWRMCLLSLRVPAKIESTFNFLEIRNLTPLHPDQVVMETEKATYSVKFQTLEDLDVVMGHINYSLSKIFPTSPLSLSQRSTPESPNSLNFSPRRETCKTHPQACCGGFSETYAALCDYNGVACREEVQWDVDTIYHSQDTRHFNILDFSHLDSRDLALIVAALAYNQWFTKLYTRDLKLGSEVVEQVLHTVSRSRTIEELEMENTGLKVDFALKLAAALAENPSPALTALNLASNPLEDKGISSLSLYLANHLTGLKRLNLSRTSLTLKGLVPLAQTLNSNENFANTLTHLDLSKNPGMLAGDEASHFYNFLARQNVLVDLNLSGTDCAVDCLFGALLHGCCSHLSYLNLSHNNFSHKKVKDTLPSFKSFFSCAFSLSYINFSGTKLPADALRALFQGLNSNTHLTGLQLDLSNCELRSSGALVIQENIWEAGTISSLDISDNGFDSDMLTLLPALSKNKSIRHLSIGKNFNVKSKMLDEILQATVQLFQDEDCSLRSLSIANSKLKARSTVIINALGSNTCLTKVDLGGNAMSDIGAKMLAKALQINTTLRNVSWDRNNTTAVGFLDVARALQNNYTLRAMPLPLSDLTQAYRNNPEKTEEALQKIQLTLLRNNRTHKFSQDQAFRLQQGIMTSTAEQMMDRLCVKVHNDLKVLRNCPMEGIVQQDARYAKEMVKDAKNSRALFPSLYELGHLLALDGPVRHILDSVSADVSQAVDKEVQVLLDSMVCLARELCPLATRKAETNQKLSRVADRVTISRTFVRGALLEEAGSAIHTKLNEVMLAVVTFLTNCIMDEILQELYQSHKKLARHIIHLQRMTEQDSMTMALLREKRARNHGKEPEEGTDDELSTSIDTLAVRRQTVHSRKIRPISNFLSVSELDLDRLTEDDSLSGRLSTSTASSQQSRSLETLADLPTEGRKLEHQTRVRPRPRRNNRQPPTKLNNVPLGEKREENGAATKLDEGLENFYNRKITSDCVEASQAAPPISDSPSAPGSKKRKPRRRSLFRFMRARSTREERPGDPESRPLSRGSEGEQEYPESAAPTPSWATDQEEEAEEAEEEEEGQKNVNRILARPVQGIRLPGMGGTKGLHDQDYTPPVDRCHLKTSTSSNESDRLEETSRLSAIPLPGMGHLRSWKPERLEAEGGPEVERRRDIPDHRDMKSLPPPPPPPPQENKPNRSSTRPSQLNWSPGDGEGPGEKVPERDPRANGCRDSQPELGRCGRPRNDEGSLGPGKERRRILMPPSDRRAGAEKPKDRIMEPPQPPRPPAPPPAASRSAVQEEEEGEEEDADRGLQTRGQEEEEEEGEGPATPGETVRTRKPPIKPRRSKRYNEKGKPEITSNVGRREEASTAPSPCEQQGGEVDSLAEMQRSSSLRVPRRPVKDKLGGKFTSFDGRLAAAMEDEVTRRQNRPPLRQKPANLAKLESSGKQESSTTLQPETTRAPVPNTGLDSEEERSPAEI